MTLFQTGDGNTPLAPEEQAELIPGLTTKEELNEWERLNMLEAHTWALNPTTMRRQDPLTDSYVRALHLRMFDQTWKWAGIYRTTEKNLGIPHHEIRDALGALLGDVRYWVDYQTFEPDEIAIRFHHRLVFIHPFSNGNGRHARLMADVLISKQGRPVFTWGSASIAQEGDFRRKYIAALRASDRHDSQTFALVCSFLMRFLAVESLACGPPKVTKNGGSRCPSTSPSLRVIPSKRLACGKLRKVMNAPESAFLFA